MTLLLATAAAIAAAFDDSASGSRSSPLDVEGSGWAGLKTGAEADIRVALGGGVAEVCAERRLGVGGRSAMVYTGV